jgi:hypothetical protein
VVVGNVVRSDTALAFYKNPANDESGSTVASTLLFSYKVTDELAPLIRVGVVSNSPPDGATAAATPDSGFGFLNPVLGATYSLKIGAQFRLAPFLGVALPLGSGGGDDPDQGQFVARNAGPFARSAMDNAMFAVNDFVVFPGVGFAFIASGFTAQIEATVLQLTRVKGKDAPAPFTQVDSSRTNFTGGIHLGYFIVPMLSVGLELRHQRWLSTPKAVEDDDRLRDNTTVAVGPRLHFKLGEKMWLRPAVAFALPVDDVMKERDYRILQIDVPFVF